MRSSKDLFKDKNTKKRRDKSKKLRKKNKSNGKNFF